MKGSRASTSVRGGLFSVYPYSESVGPQGAQLHVWRGWGRIYQPPLTSLLAVNSSFCPPSPVSLLKPRVSFSASQLLAEHRHTSVVEKWLQIQAFFLGFLILLDHGYVILYCLIICAFKHLKKYLFVFSSHS